MSSSTASTTARRSGIRWGRALVIGTSALGVLVAAGAGIARAGALAVFVLGAVLDLPHALPGGATAYVTPTLACWCTAAALAAVLSHVLRDEDSGQSTPLIQFLATRFWDPIISRAERPTLALPVRHSAFAAARGGRGVGGPRKGVDR